MSDGPRNPVSTRIEDQIADLNALHISGPCQAAYARGCRCNQCRQAWREGRRNKRGAKPAPLALEVQRLLADLDAAELNLDALRQENAMLRCRLQELGDE